MWFCLMQLIQQRAILRITQEVTNVSNSTVAALINAYNVYFGLVYIFNAI